MSAYKEFLSKCKYSDVATASEPDLLEFYKALNFSDDEKDVAFRDSIRSVEVKSFHDFKMLIASGRIKAKGLILKIGE